MQEVIPLFPDPFFSQIAKAIEQEAFKSNYFIRQSFTAMDIANPDMARQLAQFPVDGIVILGRYEKQLLRFFTQNYKKCDLYRSESNGNPI